MLNCNSLAEVGSLSHFPLGIAWFIVQGIKNIYGSTMMGIDGIRKFLDNFQRIKKMIRKLIICTSVAVLDDCLLL